MKVSELIEQLQQMPQDLPVKVEGCDCYGDAAGAEVLQKDQYQLQDAVLVTRVEGS